MLGAIPLELPVMSFKNRTNDYSRLEKDLDRFHQPYTKTVSIVIPFYRGLPLLANTISGILLQTYPFHLMELIIAEDGADGEARTLFLKIGNKFPTKLVQHPRNGYSLCTTRNLGIQAAQGEIIVLLDFDMLPLPRLIENHLRWFHVAGDVATIGPRKFIDATVLPKSIVSSNVCSLRELPDIPSASNRFEKYDNRLGQFSNFKSHPFPYNCFHGCNVAFRRDHAIDIGLFDEAFNGYCGYDDLEFGMRLWDRGNYLVYEPKALGLHQENQVVTFEQRESSRKRNLDVLYGKAPPAYRIFRETIGKQY